MGTRKALVSEPGPTVRHRTLLSGMKNIAKYWYTAGQACGRFNDGPASGRLFFRGMHPKQLNTPYLLNFTNTGFL